MISGFGVVGLGLVMCTKDPGSHLMVAHLSLAEKLPQTWQFRSNWCSKWKTIFCWKVHQFFRYSSTSGDPSVKIPGNRYRTPQNRRNKIMRPGVVQGTNVRSLVAKLETLMQFFSDQRLRYLRGTFSFYSQVVRSLHVPSLLHRTRAQMFMPIFEVGLKHAHIVYGALQNFLWTRYFNSLFLSPVIRGTRMKLNVLLGPWITGEKTKVPRPLSHRGSYYSIAYTGKFSESNPKTFIRSFVIFH